MARATRQLDTSQAATSGSRLKRLVARIYLFEWVALASFTALVVFAVLGPVRSQYVLLGLLTLRRLLVIALLAVLLATVVSLVRTAGRHGRLHAAWGELPWRRRRFWVDALRIVVACSVVDTAHALLKVYIPVITSANHDALLARLDAALLGHGGAAHLAAPLASFPLVLHAIDLLYSAAYFFILGGGLVAFFAVLDEDDRVRFFSSFCLMWQVGLLLYVLLPSWGPVFVSPNAFGKILQHMPVTVHVQQALYLETSAIVRHQYNTVIHYFGLAAFPSLHVAVVFLYALWARRSRPWFVILLVVTALMLLGSMVTGYHYLVDGLFGLLVGAFAFIVGRRWPVAGRTPQPA